LPADAASAAGKTSLSDRSPSGRIQGSEGQKLRVRQYARQIDTALRPVLNGVNLPLILATTEPMASIYRSANTYPHLADPVIAVNPETTSDVELAAQARAALDAIYAQELAAIGELYERRASQGRATSDVAEAARAATFGAVDTVLVDIDAVVPGSVDDDTGGVSFGADGAGYGVIDEIARRVWTTGGRVVAVRAAEVPGGGPVAAILRYTLGP
jgi:hypothetical protein